MELLFHIILQVLIGLGGFFLATLVVYILTRVITLGIMMSKSQFNKRYHTEKRHGSKVQV